MGVAARVASVFTSESSDITGMRTPRRLDFLPLVVNQPPTSSSTEQPLSSSEAAASTRQRRTTRDAIYFAGAFLPSCGAAAEALVWGTLFAASGGTGTASAGTLPKFTAPPFLRYCTIALARARKASGLSGSSASSEYLASAALLFMAR